VKPKLDDMKKWTVERVREQYERELQEHRSNLKFGWYQRAYNEPMSAHYRLDCMKAMITQTPDLVTELVC
jgi:hypothetical protein